MEDKQIETYVLATGIVEQLENILKELEYIRKKGVQDNYGVSIENFNMPFWSLVGMILKISFASVPAVVVMLFLVFLVSMFFSCGILGAFTSLLGSQ